MFSNIHVLVACEILDWVLSYFRICCVCIARVECSSMLAESVVCSGSISSSSHCKYTYLTIPVYKLLLYFNKIKFIIEGIPRPSNTKCNRDIKIQYSMCVCVFVFNFYLIFVTAYFCWLIQTLIFVGIFFIAILIIIY